MRDCLAADLPLVGGGSLFFAAGLFYRGREQLQAQAPAAPLSRDERCVGGMADPLCGPDRGPAKGGAIRNDVDPQDVLLAVDDSDWQERGRPVLRLVMDGLRYQPR